MKANEVFEILKELGLPVAYRMFQDEQELPYIVFFESQRDSFSADNVTFYSSRQYNIEIYTQTKDFEIEEQLENLLNEKEIFWQQVSDEYIDDEKMNQVIYVI